MTAWVSRFLPGIAALISLSLFGCGSTEEATDELEPLPSVSETAKLEYRIDSLTNENRRLRDQADAASAETRSLKAKNAELETKAAESAAKPAPLAVAPAPVRTTNASTGYDGALELFKSKDYAGAIDQFQALLDGGANGEIADNCHYWIGESYYGMGKYSEALKQFESVMQLKRSGKKPYALMMIANCQNAMGNKIAAKESYEKLINAFPTSHLVDKAKEKLARMK